MKLIKSILIALSSLTFTVPAAYSETISLQFNYTDSNGLVHGVATLSAAPVPSDPGAYLATAGTLVVTAPSLDDISGKYTLFPNSNGVNASYSPTGLFIYDNLVFPGGNPVVTNPGFLGFGGAASGSVPEGRGREINFFSNGTNTYDLYTGANGNYSYTHEFSTAPGSGATVTARVTGANARFTLLAAPEPSTWLIMGTFLFFVLRTARRNGCGSHIQCPSNVLNPR